MALQYQSRRLSNFFVFHTSDGISIRPAASLFLIFVSTTSSFSWVNFSSLISSGLLMIFVIVLSVNLGDFPNRFFKYSFHERIRSSWLAAFSLVLEVLFLFTHFIYCLPCYSRLSIFNWISVLLIWLWRYSICFLFFFSYVTYFTLCILKFHGVFISLVPFLYRDAFFRLFRLFLTANFSHVALWLALISAFILVIDEVLISVIRSKCFGYLLKNTEFVS